MHRSDRTANLLGATALAVTDVALGAATAAGGVSASAAAALVVLSTSPGLTVIELGRRVGLTQSAAVRMVDSVERAGLVHRDRGAGRGVPVRLTSAGTRMVRTLLTARGTPLTQILAVLDESERGTLADLLAKVLTRLYEQVGDAEVLCRLCDRRSCTRDAVCPVGQAERDARAPERSGTA